MSSHEHLWKKGFSKPNSTPVPNPLKIQRRRFKTLPPPLSPQGKLRLKQQAEQISQLGYNTQNIPTKAPDPTAVGNSSQSKSGEVTNQLTTPAADAVDIQADGLDDLDDQEETNERDEISLAAASDGSASDDTIQRQEISDSEAEEIAAPEENSVENPEEETDIQAKTEQPSRNFLELPVNAPGTSPSSIQRQVKFRGIGNSIQQQPVENEEKVEPEAEQEAQESDETIQRQEIPEAEEDEISSSEPQTVQRQGETSDTPDQQTEQSEEYHNFLDIPVNVPGKPSSSIQRQVNLGRLSSQVVQPIKPTPNPGLNRLNTFKSQRIESPVKPVNPVLNQSPAPTVQRQDNTEDEDIQNQSLQEPEEETVQKKETQSQFSDATATPSLEQSIQQKRGSGQALSENVRQPMEQAFGADFSQVTVHTDSESDKLNKSIQAKAFTTGTDIFFKKGEYQPDSKPGQELLAHELTHVVQQNGNQVQAKSVKQVATKSNKLQPKLNLTPTSIPQLQRRENPQEQTDKENQPQPAPTTPASPTSGDSQTPATPQPQNQGENTATPEQSESGDKGAIPVEGKEPTTGENSPSEAVATEGKTDTPETTEGKVSSEAVATEGKTQPDAGTPPATDKDTAPKAGGGSEAKAPASPDADPDFQAVVKKTKGVASKEKQHKPASAESKAAQDAAQPPGNEVESQAQANQVGEMEQAPTPGFNAAAFKAKLMERIAQTAPKTLEEADDFKNNNKLNSVKDEMQGSVDEEKAASQGDLEEKAKETPNTSGIKPKPVTPLPPAEMGETPNSIGAEKAVPQSKGNSEVEAPLKENSQKLDQQMAEADVTPEQLEKSNEPEFKTALSAKQDAQTHAQESPASYRQFEQEQLSQAKGEATGNAQEKLQGMHGERAGLLAQVVSRQTDAKGKDEQARSKVAGELQKIYTQSKTKVESILSELDGKVNSTFDTGAAAAQKAFEDYVDERMKAYKDERYSGVIGKGRWVKDKFLGLPDKVNVFYEKGRQIYLDKMNVVLDEIVSIIGTELTKAKTEVANGRQQVQDYVAKLPEDLKQVGQEAATNIQSQFDQLEETVNSKQEELINSLAQKYNEKLQAVDAKIDEMKAANQGLVDKAANAITGVINTIKKLKDMLLNVLSKAASVIGSIIKDPIGFLGNLIGGIKQGFDGFVGNIMTHLQGGLIGWLTGSLGPMGIQLPDDIFSLKGIFSLVMQVLGLTWTYIRKKAVKLFTEPIVAGMEKSVELFQVIRDVGPMGLWEQVKEQFGDLKETIIEQIKSMVITQVITAGVKWILGLLNPASAFVKAAMLIYDIVMFFVNQGSQVLALMNAIIDGIAAIASGSVGAVAKAIENALARSIPVVIGFLASLLGVSGLAKKVQGIVKKIRSRIDKAIDKVLKKAKSLFKGKKSKKNKNAEDQEDGDKNDKIITPEQAVTQIQERLNADASKIAGKDNIVAGNIMKSIHARESKWVEKNVKTKDGKKPKLLLIPEENENSWWIEVKINPKKETTKWPKAQVKGTGGTGSIKGKQHTGMFHGSNHKIESPPEIDMEKLKGKRGDGSGLELGSGLYLSHYFRDVRGYAKRKKTHGEDGWIHKFWVPEWILKSATKAEPDTSGDKAWEGKGDVVKGEWLHIEGKSWKAGYQWAIKNKEHIDKIKLEAALPPYAAANKWGRGERVEFPEDFGGKSEPTQEGHKLASGGYKHNELERENAQVKGLGD